MSVSDCQVEAIVGRRTYRRREQFCVKWKGYSSAQNTWEERRNLKCPAKLKAFVKLEKAKAALDIEALLSKRQRGHNTEFLVKWRGFNDRYWHNVGGLGTKRMGQRE